MDKYFKIGSRVSDQRGSDWEGKTLVNRNRFMRRYNETIRKAVEEHLKGRGIDVSEDGVPVIEIDPMRVPRIKVHQGGDPVEYVFPGNTVFHKGDRFPKEGEGEGGGKGGGQGQGGRVRLPISEDEWTNLIFQDLELPDMILKILSSSTELQLEQSGFSSVGPRQLLDLKKTIMKSDTRKQVVEGQIEDEIDEKKRELKKVNEIIAAEKAAGNEHSDISKKASETRNDLLREIAELEDELGTVPEFDKLDLRYRHYDLVPVPMTQAVVFFHLDVSGSMSDNDKAAALLLFRFEYAFLKKHYKNVKIVLIHHADGAVECETVDEFFSSAITGGTVYSTALKLHREIQEKRYPVEQYNIYVTYASDGDNFAHDNQETSALMSSVILPRVQHFAYLQTGAPNTNTEHWKVFGALRAKNPQLAMANLKNAREALSVFRALFKKKGVK